MAPKGARKPISLLGGTILYDSHGHRAWRVAAKIEGRVTYGPYRRCQQQAEYDLKQARKAKTKEEYRNILRRLREKNLMNHKVI